MWLLVVSAPLLPAIFMVSRHYRVKVSALCHRALAWALRLLRGRVCVKSTHAFIFSRCTHGKADSVLQTYDLYADTHPSLCISPHTSGVLEEVVQRVRPPLVLELGMHCGYSSVRLLRLLPPAGRLITVELDPLTAELGEEIILVSGFKHSQFQSGADGPRPQQYLPDLLSLEREELPRPSGCSVLLIHRKQRDLREILDHIGARPDCYCIKSERQGVTEIFYQRGSTGLDR
ncbi:Transmembrane O-methyltransferase like [Dissostichus eleginoides]|uniref:catechol O-methyltransferase n=1 Tax=Dissostichus eleginoides TaxID=100907 RepID=A0AAD9FKT6_DISEL|nr:Transmembrane O-methyltransferase like [Dissostichus eleginoides]